MIRATLLLVILLLGPLGDSAAYYAPAQGRWLSRDPIGEAGGISLLRFVGNDAINGVDPYGLAEGDQKCCADGKPQVEDDFGNKCCPEGMGEKVVRNGVHGERRFKICRSGKGGPDDLAGSGGEEQGDLLDLLFQNPTRGALIPEGLGDALLADAGKAALGAIVAGASVAPLGRAGTALGLGERSAAVATTPKLLSQFNSAGSLIQGAGELTRGKGGARIGAITGDGEAILGAITRGGDTLRSGSVRMKDGTIIGKHVSDATGHFTIDINQGGTIYKIRVRQP